MLLLTPAAPNKSLNIAAAAAAATGERSGRGVSGDESMDLQWYIIAKPLGALAPRGFAFSPQTHAYRHTRPSMLESVSVRV